MVKLKNWAVVDRGGGLPCLKGEVYGHPKHDDGIEIVTSPIVSTSGRVVTTSNREYELDGPPEPGYIAYMSSIGHVLDEAQPVKIINPNVN
jgi:hypothetical protein